MLTCCQRGPVTITWGRYLGRQLLKLAWKVSTFKISFKLPRGQWVNMYYFFKMKCFFLTSVFVSCVDCLLIGRARAADLRFTTNCIAMEQRNILKLVTSSWGAKTLKKNKKTWLQVTACHLCGAKPLPELMLVNPWLQVMACHLCGAKPLLELMLIYHPCQLI